MGHTRGGRFRKGPVALPLLVRRCTCASLTVVKSAEAETGGTADASIILWNAPLLICTPSVGTTPPGSCIALYESCVVVVPAHRCGLGVYARAPGVTAGGGKGQAR